MDRRFLPIGAGLVVLSSFSIAQGPSGDWTTYNRTLEGDRYSPLTEINTSNITNGRGLVRAGMFDPGVLTSFQTGPIAIDGTLFFTTYKHTYAIDGANGRLKWKHVRDLKQIGLGSHRGLAYLEGRVYRGYSDGTVSAIETAHGHQVWNVQIADPTKGESIPLAPIAWNGMVFVGNAGGDNFGVTGRVYALDARTGHEVWHWNSVPDTGPAADTWGKVSPQLPRAGGATWTTYSLDPSASILYVTTGNPAPDFAAYLRPGENLYTNCLVALDARNGRLLGYTQTSKRDFHDWDASAAPALIKTKAGRSLAALGSKDGLLYGIDRTTVTTAAGDSTSSTDSIGSVYGSAGRNAFKVLYRTPVTRRFNIDAPMSTTKFTRFAPGTQGGVEWNGPAFHPGLNLIFTPAIDWPTSIKLAPTAKILQGKAGKPWSGEFDNGFGKQDPPGTWGGFVTAVDADTGHIAWQYHASTPVVGGVTATGGGLLFSGDLNGYVRAFDAKNGRILWSDSTGRPIGGGIISYEANGRQYIAVAAGLTAAIWPTKKTSAAVVIYRLP